MNSPINNDPGSDLSVPQSVQENPGSAGVDNGELIPTQSNNSKKLVIIVTVLAVLLFGIIAAYLSISKPQNIDVKQIEDITSNQKMNIDENNTNNEADIYNGIVQNIEEKESVQPNNIKDFIQGRTKVEIDVTSETLGDKPYLEQVKSIKIKNNKQTYLEQYIKKAHAAGIEDQSEINVPKMIFQQVYPEEVMAIAKKFGFNAKPDSPDNDPNLYRWENGTSRLLIDTYNVNFVNYTTANNPPSYEEAKKIAIDYVASVGFLPDDYDIYNVWPEVSDTYIFSSNYDSDSPYYNKLLNAVAVGFVSKYNGLPISSGDISAKFYGNEINAYPDIYVWVGGDGEIVSASFPLGLKEEPGVDFPLKSKELALEDLLETGGVFMYSQYLEPQQGNSYCYQEKCGVKDATIESAKLVYYRPYGPPARYYGDGEPHHSGYMIPMWLFSGEGTMVRTVDGKSTYDTRVKFISGIYAIYNEGGNNIFEIEKFNLEDLNTDSFKSTFSFGFNFSNKEYVANPRQGIDYTMIVLYPDNSYGEYRGVIYDAESRETLTVPKLGNTGKAKIILYLTDFPGVIRVGDINL